MAFNDEQVLAKLSALNETHESIATTAQWIMFHRRHAVRTAQLWLQKLKESPSPKRLNLIYLANEVTQQSKARHKDDFVTAFSPIIAEAAATAYKGAASDVQNKLRRVVDVWRDRVIFEPPIIAAVEGRLEEMDRTRGGPRAGPANAAASAATSVPSELAPLVAPQQKVAKLSPPAKNAVGSATQDYEKLTDPANPIPSAPVYAARLNGLLKTLASVEGQVAESVKAREELVGALEKILATHKSELTHDKTQLETITRYKNIVDSKKQDVEYAIMSGLATEQNPAHGNGPHASTQHEVDRPEVEALTPPQVNEDSDFYDNSPEKSEQQTDAIQAAEPASTADLEPADIAHQSAQFGVMPVSTNGPNKRRRVDSGEEFPDLGQDEGLDPEVAEMMKNDQSGI